MRFLVELSEFEGGRRLILNLHDGLASTRDLPPKLARLLLEEAANARCPGSGPHWYPHQRQIYQAIYDAPSRYQYQGPKPHDTQGRWVTVKRATDVLDLIQESPWIDWPAIKARLGPFASGPTSSPTPSDCQLLEKLLNDHLEPVRFRLAKAFKDPARTGSSSHVLRMRPGPVWLSRWEDFLESAPGLSFPTMEAAGRMRDWLGLPFEEGTALFAFVAREPFDVSTRLARRPTVLDGISNYLYKHRTFPPRGLDGCGATVDITLLRDAPRDPDILDGGPEVVARRVWFHPRRFQCLYLGHTPDLEYDPDGPFHVRLLGGRDYDEIRMTVESAVA